MAVLVNVEYHPIFVNPIPGVGTATEDSPGLDVTVVRSSTVKVRVVFPSEFR